MLPALPPARPPPPCSAVWTASQTVLDALTAFNETCAFENSAAPYCKAAQALPPFRYIVSRLYDSVFPLPAALRLCVCSTQAGRVPRRPCASRLLWHFSWLAARAAMPCAASHLLHCWLP